MQFPPITLAIIVITSLVSLLALNNPKVMGRLVLWPPAVSRGQQYDRLIGYGLVHAGGMHLLFNMLTLYFVGGYMEQVMAQLSGPWAYPLLYVSALAVSILPSYLKNQSNAEYTSLGASGAVSAVLFAFILLKPWAPIYIFFIPIGIPSIVFAVVYVGYSIWMDRRGRKSVNHSAHLAGAAYGVLYMVAMEPRIVAFFLATISEGPKG